jgi:membrane fusion protein, multidrug efflux system
MKKILLSVLIPLILAVVLFTCRKQEEKKEKQVAPRADESSIAVKLTPVKKGNFSLPIISSGLISTETESKLSFKVGGMIASIMVKEGESVVKGQLLASLDLTESNAQVSQAKHNLEKAKRDLERGQRLYKDSAATLEQMQNLQTAFDAAHESFTIASVNQQFSSIRATTSGKVIRKFVNAGEQINAGVPVFVVNSAAQNDWIVKIGLPDVDWVRVKKGDKAKITFDAYPDVIFDGEVSLINEGADQINGLYSIEVKIKPNGKKLASGLFARVEILPSSKQSMRGIPIESVIEGHGRDAFVFVVNNDKKTVRRLPITIAYITNDSAVVSKGLEDVEEVITSGSAFLTEFSTIQITQQ